MIYNELIFRKKIFFEILAKGTFFLNKFFFDKNRNFTQKCNIKTESDREFFFIYFNENKFNQWHKLETHDYEKRVNFAN